MADKKIVFENPTIKRWNPDYRYREDKLYDASLNNFKSKDPSITDKEAYRVTLASLRGNLASMPGGSATVGQYSLKGGEEYDVTKDFSFLNRPDLTIVQLDEYIEHFKEANRQYDEKLSADIEAQLKMLNDKRSELVKAESEKEKNEE